MRATPESSGKLFLVRGGRYGPIDLNGARQRATVTFRGYPGERPVLGATVMKDTSGIRREALRFDGGIDMQPGENERLEIVGNDLGGFTGAALKTFATGRAMS